MASGARSPYVWTHPPVNTSTSNNVPSSDVNPQPERYPRNPNLVVYPPQFNPMKPDLAPPPDPEIEPPAKTAPQTQVQEQKPAKHHLIWQKKGK